MMDFDGISRKLKDLIMMASIEFIRAYNRMDSGHTDGCLSIYCIKIPNGLTVKNLKIVTILNINNVSTKKPP
jgi:hypothetical protein